MKLKISSFYTRERVNYEQCNEPDLFLHGYHPCDVLAMIATVFCFSSKRSPPQVLLVHLRSHISKEISVAILSPTESWASSSNCVSIKSTATASYSDSIASMLLLSFSLFKALVAIGVVAAISCFAAADKANL
uniref:Uncharacterized protein n=1 Tax=Glossina brevipalpis TaxID=37001 RepID=A0A1A9W145_9MUSC